LLLADVGYGALWLTLAVALWATVMAMQGGTQRRPEMIASARNALLVTAGLSTLAVALLLILLVTHNLGIRYVYEHTSTYLQPVYLLSAFWAGLEGSQLLWLWLLALLTMGLVLKRPGWDRELRPYAMSFLAFTQAFFAFLLVWVINPFEPLPTPPSEGIGLNPLLQNLWMIIHPPVIFAAYALWTIPAAYALAALLTGRLDAAWLRGTRRWTLAAWATLGIGILLGAWWAYLELGWGGYWSWDAVENSSFLPWLVGTAFVHAAILQERRDLFRPWSVLLPVVTLSLTVFATFITRSGLIQSVHAFAESPIGWWYLAYIGLVLAATVGLLRARTQELRGEGEVDNLLSREFAFLVTNLLLLGAAVAMLLGTLWPTFTGVVRGVAISLTAENYNRFMGPLGLLLVLLIGLCPLVDWRTSNLKRLGRGLRGQTGAALLTAGLLILFRVREGWVLISLAVVAFVVTTVLGQMIQGIVARKRATGEPLLVATARAVGNGRRRYGGQLIHLAILIIVAGIIASQAYQNEVQVALAPGEEVQEGGYRLVYRDYTFGQVEEGGNKVVNEAVVDLYRGERRLATLRPERNWHSNAETGVSEVALHSTLFRDLYLVLASLEPDGLAAFQVLITPLVAWLWIGGGVLIVGTLVAAWPSRKGRTQERER